MAYYDDISDMVSQLNSLNTIKSSPIKLRNYQNADYQYEVLCNDIKDFENSLDDEHEVALKLASFGQSITLSVTNIGYSNPSLIHFYGYVGNDKAHLIQHVNQLNFLMIAVPKANPKKPARKIGFQTNTSDED